MDAGGGLGSKSPTGGWRARLRREALAARWPEFDLLYHVSLAPAFPDEYDVMGLVAITFRLRARPSGGHEYVTALDPAAALRLGARLGLDEAASLAMVDSHERMHVWLQLAGVEEHDEERLSRFIDAVWLSLFHPRAELLVLSGELLVTEVHGEFWERLLEAHAGP